VSADDTSEALPQFLFVYGLLMNGFKLHHLLDGAEFVGEATTSGNLVSLGEYPGLLDGDGTVHGELYRFADLQAALPAVDEAEGFNPKDPHASLYHRVARHVINGAVGSVRAWVYLFNQAAADAAPVSSGDWRRVAQGVSK
jgi:gamma-glutamylcyclotransferase (GGCT)/AIG2-like uncharacterized protein YtfP